MNTETLLKRCCSFFTALLTITLFGMASTIYASELELDRNILSDGATDWENLFSVSGNNPPTQKIPLPTDYIESTFIRDFEPGESGPDISTFTTGSKDTLNITPGWECTRSNNVNDKTDVVNAYAAAYIEPGTGDLIVYYGMERYSNEGTGNIGFWFLKDSNVGCAVQESGPKTLPFTGNHMDGDTLIVAEFSNGGAVTSVLAYVWSGGAGGSLNPVGSGSECVAGGVGEDLCAVVNTSPILMANIPWLTETKQPGNTPSNDLDTSEFFEGKINLTNLGIDGCFAKFLGVTRSSTSLTATLFDYALGDFDLCSIDVSKACSTGIDNPVPNAAGNMTRTKFDITVLNDGAGTVSNVAIKEDLSTVTFGIGEFCELISIDGNATGPIDLTTGNSTVIATSLDKGDDVVAQIVCETFDNPFDNAVIAEAYSVAAGGSGAPDLSDSYDMALNELCGLTVNANLVVTKACNDVRLKQTTESGTGNTILTVEVEVDLTVTNEAPISGFSEQLTGVLVSNTVGDDGLGAVIPIMHVDNLGNPLPAFDGILDVGETAYFKSIYVPESATSGGTDPGNASFLDRVDASGIGAISSTTEVATHKTADCPLCPPDETP